MKIDESWGIIKYYKKVHNKIKAEALIIKNTDFNAVVTFWNLNSKEAENLKFDQKRSILDTVNPLYNEFDIWVNQAFVIKKFINAIMNYSLYIPNNSL